eukprot:GILI01038345.1.p1 GENE.GILI01038345.1~~GILI01038345.1.p1  ORF type:complete len:182 (+),score=20.93 GILI01038345.1:162-707(+)
MTDPRDVLARFQQALCPENGILCVNAHIPADTVISGKPFSPFWDCAHASSKSTKIPLIQSFQFNSLSQFFVLIEASSLKALTRKDTTSSLADLQAAVRDCALSPLLDRLVCGFVLNEGQSKSSAFMKTLATTVTYDWGLRRLMGIDIPTEEPATKGRARAGAKRQRDEGGDDARRMALWCA